MGRVTLAGEIRRPDGSRIEDFNGILFVTLYDKPREVTTLGDENPRMLFTLSDNRLYEGKASVRNGHFQFSLVVPKDMDYRLGSGRISLYAQQTDGCSTPAAWTGTFSWGAALRLRRLTGRLPPLRCTSRYHVCQWRRNQSQRPAHCPLARRQRHKPLGQRHRARNHRPARRLGRTIRVK
jgi:hypothetical protein